MLSTCSVYDTSSDILLFYKHNLYNIRGQSSGGAPPKIGNKKIFGVKSWFFTRNIPKFFAPPSARRNFFKCAPPIPGSAPEYEAAGRNTGITSILPESSSICNTGSDTGKY